MNLYEIDKQIEAIYEQAIDLETGEITVEAGELLEALQMERDKKVENMALWHKNVLAESRAIADEIKVLQERKKRLEAKIDWQDRWLEEALHGQKFESAKVQIGYRKSTTVELENEDEFCAKWWDNPDLVITKVDRKPNKTEIKKLIKSGTEIDGAYLVDHLNMQIK